MLLIETSSQETYGVTIQFYERTGYELAGRVADYYRAGDDKLIFAKRLVSPAAVVHSTESGAEPAKAPSSATPAVF